ncbi:MAG: hypothetical protein AABX11_03475 [Nanoarchaeota archaeon]
MIKGGVIVFSCLFLIVSIVCVSASSVDDEFRKLANYAGEYETGNINYIQLLVYTSSVRDKLNEILGSTGKEMGGILKQEQIQSILGTPSEETKWVWVEGEEREIKMENSVPAWKKIVFDGRKIQIRLNAWPSIFGKKDFNDENNNEKSKELAELEEKLVYRLNFEIEFKKPEEQLNIQSRIDNIKLLAQAFNSDPSSENAESLAKESVNAEMSFKSYFEQNGGKCEDIMSSIFGSENKRQTQQLLVNEISFCEGDNFEVIARLEMCDECEWNWINLNFDIRGRGPGFKMEEGKMNQVSPKSFENMDILAIESEIRNIIGELKQSCDQGDSTPISSARSKLQALNEALNQKSNDVWKELDKIYKSQTESMTQEQRQQFDQNYGWIKQEQEKKQKAKEMSKSNYETRKQFYSSLFSSYDVKESYYTQIEYQKRLVEEFKERGEEICNNNQDDNSNEAVDCADEQCGGKICGKGINTFQDGNATIETEVNFYCIENQCKAREEMREIVRNVSNVCPMISTIECLDGSKAFFSRYDNETNCPIETSCLKEETDSCKLSEDCKQPSCGKAECVESKCVVTELTECRESECTDGNEQICESDGRIVKVCTDGFWDNLGDCSGEQKIREEIVVGNECTSAGDCGEGNVCNNGVCQLLPQVIIAEPIEETNSDEQDVTPVQNVEEQVIDEQEQVVEEQVIDEQEQVVEQAQQTEQTSSPSEQENSESESSSQTEQSQSESSLTGSVIFEFVAGMFSKITGAVISGFEIEGTEVAQESESTQVDASQETTSSDDGQQISPEVETEINNGGSGEQQMSSQEQQVNNPQPTENFREENKDMEQENRNREDDRKGQEDERRGQEDERRAQENKERCTKDCARPCIENCIRTECGEEMECSVDEAQKKCEGTCKAEDSCIEKCAKGEDWWQDVNNKNDNKEEKGVFQVGGSCRISQGKTEGFIWFGGWGEQFEQIQFLKNKYYSGGQADWCKYDFENLKKQRQEFEKGFNQEFVTWFFEKYLANSADNWEQSVSGIFELYWKDVDNSRETAYRMQCLGLTELPSVNLINVKYESTYGKLEFWEEIKTVKLEGMDKEVQVVSPYMKVWVFPTKEFMMYEMKKSMKNHEFPGSSEDKMERNNQEGPTAEEREMIKQDSGFIDKIREISGKYDGNLDMAVQLKDYSTDEVVFNLYAQINENDILKLEPMLPEEVPFEDVKVEIDFSIIYDMIYNTEKEMQGERTESPPWDKQVRPTQKIKEITNGVKTFFKIRSIISSAKITPSESEKDIKSLVKSFMYMMMKGDGNNGDKGMPSEGTEDANKIDEKGTEQGVWDSKEKITGESILGIY